MAILVVSLFGSLIIAVVAAVVTVALTTRSFYSQKWWERKADVYSTILEALAAIVAGNQSLLRGAHVSRKATELIGDRYMKAKFRIDQLRHGGAFVVSDEVAKHLQDLDVKRRDIHERIPAVGPDVVKKYFDADNAVVAKAIEAITESVTRELRPRWWQVLSR